MPEAEGREGREGREDEGDAKDGKTASREDDAGAALPESPAEGAPDGPGDESEAKGAKSASPDAVERLKARAARGSRRESRGGSKLKSGSTRKGGFSGGGRGSRRRLSDPERQALWRKAVAKKARKIKHATDLLILLCLGCILGAHALVFAHMRAQLGGGMVVEYGPKRGYEVMLDLVKIDLERSTPEASLVSVGTKPLVVREGRALRVFEPAAPADVMSMLILIVPIGAALLLLLYLLDFLVWMGRPLPILSLLYGFGMVVYLMITRVAENGAWTIIGTGGREAMAAWFMLLVPLFLLGAFSMLRFFFSARRKRYAFAGLEPPAKPEPPKPPAGEGDAEVDGEADTESEDEPGSSDEAGKSDEPGKTDDSEELVESGEPESVEPEAPSDGPADGEGGSEADADASKTPVSSPAISIDATDGPDKGSSPDAAEPSESA